MLQIRMLGELEVLRDGAPVPLPRSRKTRALLAYLALRGTPQRRDALCDLFWEIPDDPRGALRWSLSRLRPVLNGPGAERLIADRERVGFVDLGAEIDIIAIRARAAAMETLSDDELRRLVAAFRGPLLAGLDLPNQPAFDSWRIGQQEAARNLHLRLLDALVARLDGDPAAQTDVLRQRLEIDPGAEGTHVALVARLAGAGRQAEAERQAAVSARILSAIGPFDEVRLARAAKGTTLEPPPPQILPPPAISHPEPQSIRFCTTDDRVRIAFTATGNGPPLIKTANWLNHLEHDWESPVWRGLFQALTATHRLIRYDERGNGLSDWDAEDLSFDAFMRDFEAVVDAAGLERFPIFAVSQGCSVAIEYAARHPGRVTAMVLFGGFARGWKHSSSPAFIAHVEAMRMLMSRAWGQDNPAFRQMFTSLLLPHGSRAQFDWFDRLQRVSASPANAVRLMDALGAIDVRARLAEIRVPTLVAHCRGDAFIPIGLGREIAAGIPGARFLALDSENHLLVEGDPALPALIDAMARFFQQAG